MALKRLIPLQDTFIVSGSEYNYGADEILELGCTDYGDRLSRILIQFSTDQLKDYVNTVEGEYKAILHLNISEAKNLPTTFSIIASDLSQAWAEGIGRVGDLNTEGATWEYTGLRDSENIPISWDTPGTSIWSAFDGGFAIQGSILNILDGGRSIIGSIEQTVDGGTSYWDTGSIRFYGQELMCSKNLFTDLNLDITAAVRDWVEGVPETNKGLILRFGNEMECLNYGARLSFYSSETHTVYRPYLEIKWNDSTYEPEGLTECRDFYGTFANNLRNEYTVGDIAKVNLTVKDPYAPRIWSTGSIYQPTHILPSSSYWGIKDEYTNEMIINFDPIATQISTNVSGSFFILDTANLEPERYYRLLVQVQKGSQKVIVDNKNVFRVGRNGRYKS